MKKIQELIQDGLARSLAIRKKRALLFALGTIILAIVIVAIIDHSSPLEGWSRWAGLLGGLLAAAIAALVSISGKKPDEASLAHHVEEQAGESSPVVATAIDPTVRAGASATEVSQAMLARLDQRAEEALARAPLDFKGSLKTPSIFVTFAAVSAIAVLVFLQGSQALARVVMPWVDSPYSTLTLSGPKEDVAEGRPFTLTASIRGKALKEVSLFQIGSETPIATGTPKEGLIEFKIEGLPGPADFVIRGGDAESGPLRIEPYLLPKIESFKIKTTPPSYAARFETTFEDPNFATLRGSKIVYRLETVTPVESVTFEQGVRPRAEETMTAEERREFQRKIYKGETSYQDCLLYTSPSPRDRG